MTANAPILRVVLLWHMHQPEYRDVLTGTAREPWVYLHAIKDYTDMAAHLEAVPGAAAVVNFTPVLLDQIDTCGRQIAAHLDTGKPLSDPLLAALVGPLPQEPQARMALVSACLQANRQRLIEPLPAYRRLADLAGWIGTTPVLLPYLTDGFIRDLVVWYHLAWCGETVKRGDPRIARLMTQGSDFSVDDGKDLLALIGDLVSRIIPRYRALQSDGKVELSCSPYAHPIVPLLADWTVAREAEPTVILPDAAGYPDGHNRAAAQIAAGLAVFEHHFGARPSGCWLPEGGISTAALGLLQAAGLQWTASGGTVLRNSLATRDGADDSHPHPRAYQVVGTDITCFFRDDGLSDRIGFSYADWHADDAVNNVVAHLEAVVHAAPDDGDRVIAIILDGENAWEYYPNNGYYFLRGLYERLTNHAQLRLTTFAECLRAIPVRTSLPRLVAGSWVYGTFSTWIGEANKNRAWELLVAAKVVYDRAVAAGRLSPVAQAAAERQLAVCEGSDWFWWYGDYNPATTVVTFDTLYRNHLRALYHLLDEVPPAALSVPIGVGEGDPQRGGVMRRSTAQG